MSKNLNLEGIVFMVTKEGEATMTDLCGKFGYEPKDIIANLEFIRNAGIVYDNGNFKLLENVKESIMEQLQNEVKVEKVEKVKKEKVAKEPKVDRKAIAGEVFAKMQADGAARKDIIAAIAEATGATFNSAEGLYKWTNAMYKRSLASA